MEVVTEVEPREKPRALYKKEQSFNKVCLSLTAAPKVTHICLFRSKVLDHLHWVLEGDWQKPFLYSWRLTQLGDLQILECMRWAV